MIFFNNLITVGFFPKITLPTRFTEQSSSLNDNVFSNNIDERESSGILLNQISDHQFFFTYIEKLSYIERVPKFFDIEKTDANSLENFIQEQGRIGPAAPPPLRSVGPWLKYAFFL